MEKLVEKWTRKLLDSYKDHEGVNTGGTKGLPSKPEVAEVCVNFLQILFPGYHDGGTLAKLELKRVTQDRIAALSYDFHRIIHSVLGGCDGVKTAADAHIEDLFDQLPSIRATLQTDVEAAYEGDPAAISRNEVILSYPFLEAIGIQRIAHLLYRREVPLIPRMMTEWAHAKTGIDIHPGASIGSHFFIDHGTGVVIGETCRIGARVKLYHGVTLGARSFEKDELGRIKKGGKRHPDVEDCVTIYPNATVLGGETVIGAKSTIGGNVFLMHSVPPNSLVYNAEAQVRVVDKASKGYIGDYSI